MEKGLAAAEWCHAELPRSEIKEMMHRTDRHALRDTAIWLAYGVLCGSSSVPRWHECGHGTAFRTALPVLMRQMRDEDVFMVRKPPDTARPLRADLHGAVLA